MTYHYSFPRKSKRNIKDPTCKLKNNCVNSAQVFTYDTQLKTLKRVQMCVAEVADYHYFRRTHFSLCYYTRFLYKEH